MSVTKKSGLLFFVQTKRGAELKSMDENNNLPLSTM